MSFHLDEAVDKDIYELNCILTWLAPVTLQRTSPKIHLSMNVERGVSGTETEILYQKLAEIFTKMDESMNKTFSNNWPTWF